MVIAMLAFVVLVMGFIVWGIFKLVKEKEKNDPPGPSCTP